MSKGELLRCEAEDYLVIVDEYRSYELEPDDTTTLILSQRREAKVEALKWAIHFSSPRTKGASALCQQHVEEITAQIARLEGEGGKDA
jgi:hypothetical protein